MHIISRCLLPALLFLMLHGQANASDPPRPRIVAHRGLLRHAPENTLLNFRACMELRLGFEFDVRRTKDGHLVCMHDDTVDRTTNGTGKVFELTLDEIRQLDAGGWFDDKFAGEKVPTVEEVLKLVAEYRQHDVLVAVDLKADNAAQDVVRLAKEQNVLQKLLFIGTTISDANLRERVFRSSPNALTAAVANDPSEFGFAFGTANYVYFRYMPSEEEMDAIHTLGKGSFIAGPTVSGNVPENWRMVAGLGIGGILTDYPLELRATLRELDMIK